jgi:hypothetical protein
MVKSAKTRDDWENEGRCHPIYACFAGNDAFAYFLFLKENEACE